MGLKVNIRSQGVSGTAASISVADVDNNFDIPIKNVETVLAEIGSNIGFFKGVLSDEADLVIAGASENDTYLISSENKFVRFDAIQNKFVDVGGDGSTVITDPSGAIIQQVTRTNIVGSVDIPYIVDINIERTVDYSRPPVEVLKFVSGSVNRSATKEGFESGSSIKFDADSSITFDGWMHPDNSISLALTDLGSLGTGNLYTVDINLSNYRSINSLEVN